MSERTVTILTKIDGRIHLTVMQADELDAIELLIKRATKAVIPTSVTQAELNRLLGYDK